jgi:alkylation response protein AidB-like acyl-CoA dehydrogenase
MLSFTLDEQQLLIKESIEKFSLKQYSFDIRESIVDTQSSFSPDVWKTFAELGWLAIPFEEKYGGLGARPSDVSLMMKLFGEMLLVEPFLESVIISGRVLSRSINQCSIAEDVLSQLIAGEVIICSAFIDNDSNKGTTLESSDDGFILQGSKRLVIQAQHANYYIVSAQMDNQKVLCLVPSDCEGVKRCDYEIIDGTSASDVSFDAVSIPKENILSTDETQSILNDVDLWLSLAISSELLGSMRALIDKTSQYMKTRKQFGFPISFFQALQHRLVDLDLLYEQSQSLLDRALYAYSSDDSDVLDKEIFALRSFISKASKTVAEEAIQLHGGMGMTDELDIGHYAKRILFIRTLYGHDLEFTQKFCEVSYGR